MPTWGLSMEEGTIVGWRIVEGSPTVAGVELVEIETSKIANCLEAREAELLRMVAAVCKANSNPVEDLAVQLIFKNESFTGREVLGSDVARVVLIPNVTQHSSTTEIIEHAIRSRQTAQAPAVGAEVWAVEVPT